MIIAIIAIYLGLGTIVSATMYYTSTVVLPLHREIVSHTVIALVWPFIVAGIVKDLLK